MPNFERLSFAETATEYDYAHSGDFTSPTPFNMYPSSSIGTGTFEHPIQQHSSHSSQQTEFRFVPPSPATQHKSSWTQQRMRDNYGFGDGIDGHQPLSGSHSSPQHSFAGNSPNDLNAPSAAPGHNVGPSSTSSTEKLHKQMQVKDKVITELAGIARNQLWDLHRRSNPGLSELPDHCPLYEGRRCTWGR